MKLTKAELRALRSVKNGEVMRVYRQDGNVFQPPDDVRPQTVWRLERNGLIRDGKSDGGVLQTRVRVELTKAGEDALSAATADQ